jgi:hypothetical protein
MSTPSTIYYTASQLKTVKSVDYDTEIVSCLAYKQMQQAVTYSNSALSSTVGNIYYDISVLKIPNGSVNTAYDCETGYIFWNDSSINSIVFSAPLFNPSTTSIFPPGTYNFPILGGTGTYLGAKGSVQIIVNSSGLRTVSFSITY